MQDPKRVNPPVTTDPQPIELGGGLDFTRPKLMVDPGTLLDNLNFESIDELGYSRIAGCEPFDGTTDLQNFPFNQSTVYTATVYKTGNNTLTWSPGEIIEETTTPAIDLGLVLDFEFVSYDSGLNRSYYLVTYKKLNSSEIDSGFDYNPDGDVSRTATASTGSTSSTSNLTVAGVNGLADFYREDITALHSTATGAEGKTGAIGLHWFRDRLYAVANELTVYFDSGGTTELFPNQYIKSGAATGRVLYVQLNSGTWGAGTAAGFMQVASYETGAFANNSVIATYTADDFLTPLVADIATVALVSDISGDVDPDYAGMFVARSEEQAADEGGNDGWTRIDCGWEVDFDAGYAESGELTKIEKGTTPNYTPGTGTTSATTANLLRQAVDLGESEPAQVQGWKSTAAETVYATTSAATTADDNVYLYGDFFTQQWGLASGGAVYTTQPSGGVGASDSAPLQEFDPAGQTLSFTIPGAYSTTIFGSNGYTYFCLNGFDGLATAVPENARITGITVSVKYDSEVLYKGWPHADADIWLGFDRVALEAQIMTYDEDSHSAVKVGSPKQANMDFTFANYTETHDETVGSERKVRWTKNAESTLTFGGATDLWGLSTITRASVVDPDFTIGFRGRVDCGTTSVPGNGNDNILIYRPLIDYITVQITYVTDSVRYYFSDGSNILQGDLVYYDVVEGTFQGGDAEGTMQLVNVLRVSGAGNIYNIRDNMTIHTSSTPSAGNQVAVVNGAMVYNGLPGRAAILDANSRYQFITANFYGTDNLDGMYGVSGAGKAFSLNTYLDDQDDFQEYIVKITTNSLDEDGDKPRHVAFHHYALALGFSSGIVRLSVLGEPENFDGQLGAAEVGVGDKVTGLLSMKGMTLGVFCEGSIWGIVGTDSENYTTQVLVPDAGAIEYTAVNMLGEPIFCTPSGISTFSQTAAYGNFAGERVSQAVTPWILRRMVRYTDLESADVGRGIAGAIACRAKNQYRPFFRDGKMLFFTLRPGSRPAPTFVTYYIGQTAVTQTGKYLVPLAWSSEQDQRGVERIHVAHYSDTSEISQANSMYVYELERGWGFAGKFIPAFWATNWITKDPWKEKTIKKVRVDGLSYGFGSSVISVAKDYEEVYNTVTEPVSLPATPDDSLSDDFKATSHMGSVARTGRNFSIKVEETIPTGDTIDDPTPPVVYQLLLTQYAPDGKTDT